MDNLDSLIDGYTRRINNSSIDDDEYSHHKPARRTRMERARLRFFYNQHPNNDFTGKHPYMISYPGRWAWDRNVNGFREQLRKQGLFTPEIFLFIIQLMTWRYKDLVDERAAQDSSMDTWWQSQVDIGRWPPQYLTQAVVDSHGWVDPFDETPLQWQWARRYLLWRRIVKTGFGGRGGNGDRIPFADSFYDDYKPVLPIQYPFLLRKDIKPISMHWEGKPVSYMPAPPQDSVEWMDYGWFFQDRVVIPDFTYWEIEPTEPPVKQPDGQVFGGHHLGNGASHWTSAQLDVWKTGMTPFYGKRNPFYFGDYPTATDIVVTEGPIYAQPEFDGNNPNFRVTMKYVNTNSYEPIDVEGIILQIRRPRVEGGIPSFLLFHNLDGWVAWDHHRLIIPGSPTTNIFRPQGRLSYGESVQIPEMIMSITRVGVYTLAMQVMLRNKTWVTCHTQTFEVLPDIAPPDNEVDIGI